MNHIPLPISFVDRVNNDDFYPDNLLESLDIPGQVSVRINPKKIDRLTGVLESVPWCSTGFYLKERPVYTLNPLFHAGAFYPQEAGSMLLDCVLQQIDLPASACVLDLCAAPGGKTRK